MPRKSLSAMICAIALAGCAQNEPRAAFNAENLPTRMVQAPTIEFVKQGVRGGKNSPAAITSLDLVFSCLADFDGRSATERAQKAMSYSSLVRNKASSWLINPRVKGQWLREIRKSSVPNEGCNPQYKQMELKTVSSDRKDVAMFLLRNPAALAYLQSLK